VILDYDFEWIVYCSNENDKPTSEIAQFTYNPWRHGAGFDPSASIVACISAHGDADLPIWTSPYSAAVLVDHANCRHLLRNVAANKMGHG
jgi:hypothetical protein